MSLLMKVIILYLGVGILIALSPYYYLRKLNDKIESGEYIPLKAYDLLLFNTVVDTSGLGMKVFVFLIMVLFYPIMLLSHLRKHRRKQA